MNYWSRFCQPIIRAGFVFATSNDSIGFPGSTLGLAFRANKRSFVARQDQRRRLLGAFRSTDPGIEPPEASELVEPVRETPVVTVEVADRKDVTLSLDGPRCCSVALFFCYNVPWCQKWFFSQFIGVTHEKNRTPQTNAKSPPNKSGN